MMAQPGNALEIVVRDLRMLEGMNWQRIGWLAAIAAGLSLHAIPNAIFVEGAGAYATGSDYVEVFVELLVHYVVGLTPILIALTVADNVRVDGWRRVAVLVVALLAGAQVASALKCLLPIGYECVGFASGGWRFRLFTEDGLWTVVIGGLLALAYFYRRHDLRIAEALHDAELARVDMQRETLAADLQATQARVEPAFLFETLGAIGELYARDPGAGERILDELIRYLRAMLPDLRGSSSTLEREVELARAYVSILDLHAGRRLALDIDVSPDVASVIIAPMIILPLLSAALDPHAGDNEMPTSLRLGARVDGARVRISISGSGPAIRALAGDIVVREMRERLLALYGDRAALTIDAASERQLAAVIEIPHETV